LGWYSKTSQTLSKALKIYNCKGLWSIFFFFCTPVDFLHIIYFNKCYCFYPLSQWNTNLSNDWQCPILELECVSSHLRSCVIINFNGLEDDLQFATYILRNARLLQVMSIHVPNKSSKHLIWEEVSSYPRISTGCKLFVDH
jgi:hypothetical protein